jgi:hypothetical protein
VVIARLGTRQNEPCPEVSGFPDDAVVCTAIAIGPDPSFDRELVGWFQGRGTRDRYEIIDSVEIKTVLNAGQFAVIGNSVAIAVRLRSAAGDIAWPSRSPATEVATIRNPVSIAVLRDRGLPAKKANRQATQKANSLIALRATKDLKTPGHRNTLTMNSTYSNRKRLSACS